ncbi:cupin domain-containing protein [Flavobacterium subsaxonicum]|uniref:Cupin n=1 Tax=Flavobacterium subsaxonicum WB 4.1-42 = DSM 21790 TaxID=1121898 RepID=A0A0A2MIN6_9FLAO|nr:cupin domain-containing protein [Flavobacterium subsaxonicum]KGO91343.1 cupin [Flavobacterium subsaxonicum WB 4.1-42 = DSM 21790]
MEIQHYHFKDNGVIPNNSLPLLVYKFAFPVSDSLADVMEETFASHNWTNSWRNGVFPYHHYHSITHEVLGVYSGQAQLHLGGEQGEKIDVEAGDVLVIPAGVGHKKIAASADFGVIGAYPDGKDYDVLTGKEGERPRADERIAAVPRPETDPVLGKEGGIAEYWK